MYTSNYEDRVNNIDEALTKLGGNSTFQRIYCTILGLSYMMGGFYFYA